MPRRCKVAALSSGLAPLFFSIAAIRHEGSSISVYAYWCVAGLMWLTYAFEISLYFRGYFASRRGVQPGPPDKQPHLGREKEMLLVYLCVVAFMGLVDAISQHTSANDLRLLLVFAALTAQQASTYARHLFWDVNLGHAGAATTLHGQPS